MTQDQYNEALESATPEPAPAAQTESQPGGSEAPAPQAQTQAQSQDQEQDLSQFIPLLVALQSTQAFLSAAPTFIPQTFQEQIQFVFDGTNYYAYLYFNNQWNAIRITSPGLVNASGTDTYSISGSHSFSTPHTITHGLGVAPKIIMATVQLNPNGVAGSNVFLGTGIGTIMVNGSGTPIGGSSISFQIFNFGGGGGTENMIWVGTAVNSTSISSTTTTSGGTATITVTVNNVTATTFDLVYSGSDTGGAGAPTQSFSVTWTVLA